MKTNRIDRLNNKEILFLDISFSIIFNHLVSNLTYIIYFYYYHCKYLFKNICYLVIVKFFVEIFNFNI